MKRHIEFIQMGGTIDKGYPKKKGGWAFEIGEPALNDILNSINPSFTYSITSICKKDSQAIDKSDRNALFKFILSSNSSHFIITHGTDSMIETGRFLLENGVKGKVIVLVGSFLPYTFKDNDAAFNVGCAIGALFYLSPGVYIAMNGIVERLDKIKRRDDGKFILKDN